MDYNDVLEHLAPCGVDCVRYADYSNGEIRRLSLELIKLLGCYERVAKLKKKQYRYLKIIPTSKTF